MSEANEPKGTPRQGNEPEGTGTPARNEPLSGSGTPEDALERVDAIFSTADPRVQNDPAMQKTYKEIKATLTKATQDFSEEKQALAQKAEWYDALSSDPVATTFFQKYRETVEAGKDPWSLFAAQATPSESPNGDVEELDPQEERLLSKLRSELKPLQEKMSQAEVRQAAERKAQEFAAKNPGWEKYREQMLQIFRENPGVQIPLEVAYRAAQAMAQERQESAAARQARLEGAVTETPGASTKPVRSTARSRSYEGTGFNDALNDALESLGYKDKPFFRDMVSDD